MKGILRRFQEAVSKVVNTQYFTEAIKKFMFV
jgi:hypothetical protein